MSDWLAGRPPAAAGDELAVLLLLGRCVEVEVHAALRRAGV